MKIDLFIHSISIFYKLREEIKSIFVSRKILLNLINRTLLYPITRKIRRD